MANILVNINMKNKVKRGEECEEKTVCSDTDADYGAGLYGRSNAGSHGGRCHYCCSSD